MELSSGLMFAAVLGVACAAPGPTVAALVARVLGKGVGGAPAFCGGLLLGDLVWLSCAGGGLAFLATALQPVFTVIKYAGAAYLLYLAWKLWTARVEAPTETKPAAGEGVTLLLTGLSIALSNPKTMFFYIALMPTIIDLSRLTLLGAAELAVIVALVNSVVLASYVLLAVRARRLLRSAKAMRVVNRASGGVMAGAAVAVATR